MLHFTYTEKVCSTKIYVTKDHVVKKSDDYFFLLLNGSHSNIYVAS